MVALNGHGFWGSEVVGTRVLSSFRGSLFVVALRTHHIQHALSLTNFPMVKKIALRGRGVDYHVPQCWPVIH